MYSMMAQILNVHPKQDTEHFHHRESSLLSLTSQSLCLLNKEGTLSDFQHRLFTWNIECKYSFVSDSFCST